MTFLRAFLCAFGLMLAPFIFSVVLLRASYELSSLDRIVDRQQRTQALYGSATWENLFSYKRAIADYRRPRVVALGSSRTLQYREEMFTSPFANVGGAMTSLQQGRRFLERVNLGGAALIVNVDPWWFSDRWTGAYDEQNLPDEPSVLSSSNVTLPLQWIAQRKMTVAAAVRLILQRPNPASVSDYPRLGVKASETQSGFRRDGSFEYGALYDGLTREGDERDRRFERTLERVDASRTYFDTPSAPAPALVAEFGRFISEARRESGALVLIVTPLAPEVSDRLLQRDGARQFLEGVSLAIAHAAQEFDDVEFYDLSDQKATGRHSCEYVDGIHEGDVMVQRELLAVLTAHPTSALHRVLDADTLSKNIERFSGRAVSTFEAGKYHAREQDFLELGCAK